MLHTGFVIWTIALIIVKVESSLTECAPEAEVQAALSAAERRAAEYLDAAEASALVDVLKRSGTTQPNGTICFTDADFERFGSLVSAFFREHESKETVRQQSFNFDGQKQSSPIGGGNCYCGRCSSEHESYCTKSFVAVCCPHYCANIFSAVAVAALSGVEGSGLDTCCDGGKKACPKAQVAGQRTGASQKKSNEGSSTPPELDFGIDAANVMSQTGNSATKGLGGGIAGSLRGRPTVTPTPSVSPSPSLAYDNDVTSSDNADWSSSPSPSADVRVTPSTEPSMPSTDANSISSPLAIESVTAIPSVSGPSPPSDNVEFEGGRTETFSTPSETILNLVSEEEDEEIQSSPEDHIAVS